MFWLVVQCKYLNYFLCKFIYEYWVVCDYSVRCTNNNRMEMLINLQFLSLFVIIVVSSECSLLLESYNHHIIDFVDDTGVFKCMIDKMVKLNNEIRRKKKTFNDLCESESWSSQKFLRLTNYTMKKKKSFSFSIFCFVLLHHIKVISLIKITIYKDGFFLRLLNFNSFLFIGTIYYINFNTTYRPLFKHTYL